MEMIDKIVSDLREVDKGAKEYASNMEDYYSKYYQKPAKFLSKVGNVLDYVPIIGDAANAVLSTPNLVLDVLKPMVKPANYIPGAIVSGFKKAFKDASNSESNRTAGAENPAYRGYMKSNLTDWEKEFLEDQYKRENPSEFLVQETRKGDSK